MTVFKVSFKKFAYYAGINSGLPSQIGISVCSSYRAEFPIEFTLSLGYCKEIL